MSSSSSESDFEEQEEFTVANVAVLNKYKLAGELANKVVKVVIEKCVEGQSVRELCLLADTMIASETALIFKKEKDLRKGVAFPTCISVNNCVCHFSPLKSDPDYLLKTDDLVKIDLAVHIDGYIASIAYTHIVGLSKDKPATGRKADVVRAAYTALDAAMRVMKGAVENFKVTDVIQKAAEAYQCKPIEGMLSHQLYRNQFEGKKSIIQNPNEAQKREHEKAEFNVNEVYALDILISSGEGKAKELTSRTTIYRKTDSAYMLKMKTSRAFFSEVTQKYDTMAFNLRNFEDEKRARLGIAECSNHGLLTPFPVLYEKEGEYVAQFKFTVAITATGLQRITSIPLDTELYKSEHKVSDADLKEALSAGTKTNKKKKAKAKKAAGDAANAMLGLKIEDGADETATVDDSKAVDKDNAAAVKETSTEVRDG